MTLGTIFRSVLGPSGSPFSGHPAAGHSHEMLSERNSDYYHYGSHRQHKGKSKSDKKHAILSALTLLAFLFFLNILQNCIREQNANRGGATMFGSAGGATAPSGHQAKDPLQDLKSPENPPRKKRDAEEVLARNRTGRPRTSRALLGLEEPAGDLGRRQVKFIRNFSSINNWTRELSQMSDRDLDEQKLKTLNFPLYWKNNRFSSTELRSAPPRGRVRGPSENRTVPHPPRRFKKRERTSGGDPTRADGGPPSRDRERAETFRPSPRIPERPPRDRSRERTPDGARREETTTPRPTPSTPSVADPGAGHVATTPRNRRSDYGAPRPADYEEYEGYGEQIREEGFASPAPPVGLDLNTFQTFPVYNYYNHRPGPHGENQTLEAVAAEPATPEIDRMHSEAVRVTTQQPLFHPTRTAPSHPKFPHHKHRNRYPNHHGLHHVRNHHLAESRYRYSPYRKAGVYEAPHFHDHPHEDFYPPVVLAKYEVQHDEPGFDLTKFLWSIVHSFARPLTRLVPGFAKENDEEAQCYDLLVCEAQRVSRFMGPTAEALAATVGTLLTWAATEETRQIVVDAINSGRENTCQQQIRDCEDRSGGKSAMTVIAQVMEMKL